jgi:hypothetical protein
MNKTDMWIIATTKMTSGPQKWDEGPNDTKYFYPETTYEHFTDEEKANSKYDELSSKTYLESVKLYQCSELKRKVKDNI